MNCLMKKRKSEISLIISLGIHFILMLILSPFLVQHFNVIDEDLSLVIYRVGNTDRMKRRLIHQPQRVQPESSKNNGSFVVSRATPKYAPETEPPKALIFDEIVPEIVTNTDLPQTDTSTLSNVSLGKNTDAAGPVVIPEVQGSGSTVKGPGRVGSGNGKGDGFGKGLSNISDVDDLASIELDEGIVGLGIFDTDVEPGHGLIGQVYIPGFPIYRIPNFEKMTPIYTFATAKLDVSSRHYTVGFPTPQKQTVLENFAIHFRGKLAIDTPGRYTFELFSDDGAKLYINGKLVVDNDGTHDPQGRRSQIKLAAGFHPVEIHYFQGPRYQIALQWYYTPPNRPRQIVPPEVIFHPGKAELPETIIKLRRRLNDAMNGK